MGMFSYVRCTQVMPDGLKLSGLEIYDYTLRKQVEDGLYQTKCIPHYPWLVEITEDNLLVEVCGGTLNDLAKGTSKVIDYTGTVEFYGGPNFSSAEGSGCYVAEVESGNVKSIKTFYAFYNTPERQAEDAERKAAWDALSPEEQEAKRQEFASQLGNAVLAMTRAQSMRDGFMRKLLTKAKDETSTTSAAST